MACKITHSLCSLINPRREWSRALCLLLAAATKKSLQKVEASLPAALDSPTRYRSL